jgi:hypothetical protein
MRIRFSSIREREWFIWGGFVDHCYCQSYVTCELKREEGSSRFAFTDVLLKYMTLKHETANGAIGVHKRTVQKDVQQHRLTK